MNHLISEWDDLTITPYLASDSLPKLIQDCINLGQTTQEKDIALMSALTAASAVMPNYLHEPISQGRVASGATEIENPRLSCLLTGTFGQFQKLVPSVENGFFSRLTKLSA